MSIQYQSQNRKLVLITGGNGDMAQAILNALDSTLYEVSLPSKSVLDVSSDDSVKSYFSDRRFDIIINSAGKLYSSEFIDSVPEKWIDDINVNLIGTYLVCRYGLAKNKSTKIINISSTAGFNSYRDWTSYCASKAGVIRLSGGLYNSGFDITTMCPGAIQTKLRDGLSINNSNVMDLDEGIQPILQAIDGNFRGKVVFYRKNSCEIWEHRELCM